MKTPMPRKGIVTKEIEERIIARLNERPRRKVAEEIGVSLGTLYRIIKKHGGEMRYDLSTRHSDIEDTVRRLWPTMSASEISKATGISKSVILRWHQILKVAHTPETVERLEKERKERFAVAKQSFDQVKKAEKWRHTYRMEQWRVLSGMKQKTGFRIKVIPNNTYRVMWYLANKYDYFFERGRAVLYYDSQTRRARNEGYFIDKYHLRFEQADD